MKSNVKSRVHIAPVGFEVDRVVEPLKKLQAERVWLISERDTDEDKGKKFLDQVKEKIERELPNCEIRIKTCDVINRDLYDNLKIYREILEDEDGNFININVSTGTKIQSIAGILASMFFKNDIDDIYPYYAIPEKYNERDSDENQLTSGLKDIVDIPIFPIQKPQDQLIKALYIFNNSGKKELTKKEFIELLDEADLLQTRMKQSQGDKSEITTRYVILKRKFLDPLQRWGFVTTDPLDPRAPVKISSEGKNMLKFLCGKSETHSL